MRLLLMPLKVGTDDLCITNTILWGCKKDNFVLLSIITITCTELQF